MLMLASHARRLTIAAWMVVVLQTLACGGSNGTPPAPTPEPTPEPSVPTPTPAPGSGVPVLGGCQVFPADNWWNRDISAEPVDPLSDNYIASINSDENADRDGSGRPVLHADFGSNPEYGIPYTVVPESQALVLCIEQCQASRLAQCARATGFTSAL